MIARWSRTTGVLPPASVQLITPAVSLGSVDTLIQHPAGLTHRVLDESARQECGITDGLLRLSVGIESLEDLWIDLAQALDTALASTALAGAA